MPSRIAVVIFQLCLHCSDLACNLLLLAKARLLFSLSLLFDLLLGDEIGSERDFLQPCLVEFVRDPAKTRDTYLAAQFRRFSRRFGQKNEGKAIFAVAHTMLVGLWWMLTNGVDYLELGGDYFEQRTYQAAHTRRLVRQLERLGHQVSLTPAT